MTTIARYPEFSSVHLEHREEVERVLSTMARPVAEWTFANLYLFRGAHGYRFELESQLEIPDPACLLTRDQRGELWSVRQVSTIDPQAFLSGQ